MPASRPKPNFVLRLFLIFIVVLVSLTACRRGGSDDALPIANAAYYWRTSWHIDSTEAAFLIRHDIHRVYCRYFDVVMRDGEPMPNATIRFETTATDNADMGVATDVTDSIGGAVATPRLPPGVELVPTVYITADCMDRAPRDGWTVLARRLVDRVVQMNATHGLPAPRELQVDCDYTRRSRQAYYEFLGHVRSAALSHDMRLSATIRLHQLPMPPPPADYGVLMVYNTGDPQRFTERNPILDVRDVQPYLRHLAAYPLPLAAAYPVYRWQRTVATVRIEHSVEGGEIVKAKTMVEQARPDMARTILIYSLDTENINRYDNDTYQAIYRH